LIHEKIGNKRLVFSSLKKKKKFGFLLKKNIIGNKDICQVSKACKEQNTRTTFMTNSNVAYGSIHPWSSCKIGYL